MGVRKRGGARRGRGCSRLFVYTSTAGPAARARSGFGRAARTNCGSERHGALPGDSRPCPALPAAGERHRGSRSRAGRGPDTAPPTETSPGAARPRFSPGRGSSGAPNTAAPVPPRSHAGPGGAASSAGPGSLSSHTRPSPLLSHPPLPAPAPPPKSFQVREAQLYRGRAGLGWWRPPWLRSGPAALSRPAEEMGSSGASPPGPAALPGTARRPPPRPAGTARPQVRDGGHGGDGGVGTPLTPGRDSPYPG